jgi:hypothetical protein
MHQLRVDLTAGKSQVAHGQGVHLEGGHGLSLGYVNLIVGGGIEDDRRIELRQAPLDRRGVGDVYAGALKGGNLVTAGGEFGP